MALSDDQRAMLKLVSQPDTSYEDIAALMGLSVDDVRAKVDDALRQLDSGADASGEPSPQDRRDAAEADEAPAVEAEEPTPAPEPEKPKEEAKPAAKETPPPTRSTPSKPSTPSRTSTPSPKPALKLPDDKGARYGLLA